MSEVFAVRQFTGGMNDWVHPGLLHENTAAQLVDAELDDGKLVPLKRPRATPYADPASLAHYGTADRSVVKWNDRHYWSDNTATSAPYYGGTPENYLGIPFPAYSGTGKNVTVEKTSPGTGETGMSGTFKYCVTFVNVNGWEGAPGSLEEYETEVTLSTQIAAVTVTWSDSRISYAKIYRTIDHGADFYCVGEVSASGSVFRDTVTDELAQMMNPLSTQYAYPPPDGGKFLCEYGGVFFLAVGSLLYFSAPGNPHAWPPTHFLGIDDTITGLVPEFQGILVFTRGNVYRVTGAEDPETVAKIYIPGNHGCVNFRSIATVNNAPVWLSGSGICIWDGDQVAVPSYQVIHTENMGVKCAVSAHDRYFLFLNGKTIVFDRRNGDVFYTISPVCDYAWHDDSTDKLYLLAGGHIYEYGGGEPLTMTYVSPTIPGTQSAIRKFREILLCGTGESRVTVSVDGKEIADFVAASGRARVKLPLSAVGGGLSCRIRNRGGIQEMAVIYD